MAETVTDPIDLKLNPANSQTNSNKPVPFFNKANAKLYAARSAEMRKQALLERQQAEAKAETEPKPVHEQASAQGRPDPFVSTSLAQARKQLVKLYSMLNKAEPALEPSEIDKIASAISKFSDIEQKLAMRPGPGTIKPTEQVKQTRANWLLSGSESESAPTSKQEQE